MTQLDVSEIVPGVVARLDTRQLRSIGGSETNAQLSDTEDRAVTDVHDFLVVAGNAAAGTCTAIPLFPKSSPGSAPLDPKKQWGNIDGWLTDPVHDAATRQAMPTHSRTSRTRRPAIAAPSEKYARPMAPCCRRLAHRRASHPERAQARRR